MTYDDCSPHLGAARCRVPGRPANPPRPARWPVRVPALGRRRSQRQRARQRESTESDRVLWPQRRHRVAQGHARHRRRRVSYPGRPRCGSTGVCVCRRLRKRPRAEVQLDDGRLRSQMGIVGHRSGAVPQTGRHRGGRRRHGVGARLSNHEGPEVLLRWHRVLRIVGWTVGDWRRPVFDAGRRTDRSRD